MKNILCLMGLWGGLALGLWAQSPEELFEIALRENLELMALRQEYQASLEQAPQVGQLPDPQVGVGAFLSPVETRLGPQRARLSASQLFPAFGTLRAREAKVLSQAQVKVEQVAVRELTLFYQIQQAYFTLYELDASQDITKKSIHLLSALKEIVEAKVASGTASLAEVLMVDLDLQALKKEIEILEAKKSKPKVFINQLLNRDPHTSIRVDSALSVGQSLMAKDSLIASAQAGHPMLRMFYLQQEVARQSLIVNEKEGKPTWRIGMDYLLVDSRTDAFPDNNGRDIFQVHASLSLPIYRRKYQAKEREEQYKIEALENQKTDLQTRFASLIEQAFSDYESARLMYELYSQQITTTQSAIRILETAYSNEGKSFDELLRLERDLLGFERKQLKAVVMSHMAQAEIQRYVGREVLSK